MVRLFNLFKNKKGYISVESIVIAGGMLGFGLIGMLQFENKANQSVDNSLESLNTIVNEQHTTNKPQMIQLSDLTNGLPKE